MPASLHWGAPFHPSRLDDRPQDRGAHRPPARPPIYHAANASGSAAIPRYPFAASARNLLCGSAVGAGSDPFRPRRRRRSNVGGKGSDPVTAPIGARGKRDMPGLWAVFTLIAAGGQVLRNAQQKELTQSLGTVGATHVRFLFGLPFGLLFLLLVLAATGQPPPTLNGIMLTWTAVAAVAQIGSTALLLTAMRERSFVVVTAYAKTEPIQVAV